MKRTIKYLGLIVAGLFFWNTNVSAVSATTYVNLENLTSSTDAQNYTNLPSYDSLDSFLSDYNSNSLADIYLTNFLFDGVGAVKTPDLDDFIENSSNDTKIKTLEIQVININTTGDIEFTGEITGAMIAVNTNNVKSDINLILNNVNLDTDSKKAPAVFIYNQDITYTGAKVTIKTKQGTKNYLEGGKLKKVSLLGSDELTKYTSNYSGEALTNYQSYTSYYGIYTADQIKNILFATVKADSEDLQDGDPLYFYKGSGAISSDIDLYFEGEGYLEVTSKNKEGIETKGNLTLSGGTGDYAIYAYDDCLNTTTANSVGANIHNTMTIDVNSLLAVVDDEGDEGDAIDSNGTLTINGGTIYAFAHSTSQDAGLDSEDGIYINGGTIIATGNMADAISAESTQQVFYAQFSQKISAGTTLILTDQSQNPIIAFKTNKDIQTLLYSNPDLANETIKIYSASALEGEEINGFYTKIANYTLGQEISYTKTNSAFGNMMGGNKTANNTNTFILILFVAEILLLAAISTYAYFAFRPQTQ